MLAVEKEWLTATNQLDLMHSRMNANRAQVVTVSYFPTQSELMSLDSHTVLLLLCQVQMSSIKSFVFKKKKKNTKNKISFCHSV